MALPAQRPMRLIHDDAPAAKELQRFCLKHLPKRIPCTCGVRPGPLTSDKECIFSAAQEAKPKSQKQKNKHFAFLLLSRSLQFASVAYQPSTVLCQLPLRDSEPSITSNRSSKDSSTPSRVWRSLSNIGIGHCHLSSTHDADNAPCPTDQAFLTPMKVNVETCV